MDELSPVRFEHHREALGIGEASPRLSWQVASEPGWRQAAYELAIGNTVFRVNPPRRCSCRGLTRRSGHERRGPCGSG